MDAHGRMIGRNTVHFIEMPCAGMVKPKWLKYVLDKGASGAFVVSCFPGSCHHRRGACVFHGRWEGSRDPALDRHVSQSRIRLFEGHLAARDDLLRRLEEFLQKIANMDASLQTRETTQNEPPVPVEETEDPM
jgi:coenzyme F420-reducing hydrogenase delta subunit